MKALCVILILTSVLHGAEGHEGHHHHEHEHDSRDAAKFRYSKQANVDAAAGNYHEDSHGHHDHDHGHHHHHHDHGHHHHDHDHGHHHHDHDHGHHHHDHGHHHHDHGHHHHDQGHHHHDHGHHHHDHGHHHHDHGHHHHHDHGHHHENDHDHVHHHGQEHGSTGKKAFKVDQDLWLYALGSTTLISAAPFFILFFIPLQSNDAEFQPLLKVLLSFASGGLLGDAFLHLIPHAVEYQNHHSGGHEHHHHHHHGHSGSEGHDHPHVHDLTIGLSVIGGFVLFLLIEKFVRLCNGGEHSHSHGGHSHAATPEKQKKNGDHHSTGENKKSEDSDDKSDEETDDNLKDNDKMSEMKEKENSSCDMVKHEAHHDVKVTGYLNLVADFTHNFTDGLTIATSYLLGHQIGIVSTVTILFHEIPHEIGDFSILIQSGFSKRKAIMMQLVTAVGALSGTLIGLLAQGLGDEIINLYILPFTAGGFIYIATVSVIPELLEETKFVPTVVQLVAMFLGVYLMVVISWYE